MKNKKKRRLTRYTSEKLGVNEQNGTGRPPRDSSSPASLLFPFLPPFFFLPPSSLSNLGSTETIVAASSFNHLSATYMPDLFESIAVPSGSRKRNLIWAFRMPARQPDREYYRRASKVALGQRLLMPDQKKAAFSSQ